MIILSKRFILILVAAFCGAVAAGSPALAAPPPLPALPRTFVSALGTDLNPCLRLLPCRTFQTAIDRTAPGGEVDCVDSGSYGPIVITSAISIICDGAVAGVGSANDGITINAGDTDFIFLSGLDISGTPSSLSGVNFISGGSLQIISTTIRGFGQHAIEVAPGAGKLVSLYLRDVTITNNGTSGNSATGAVDLRVGTGGITNVLIEGAHLAYNQNSGLQADTSGVPGGLINLTVRNSAFASNGTAFALRARAGDSPVHVSIDNATIIQNSVYGIRVRGGNVSVIVSNSTITSNQTGVFSYVGSLDSFGDNRLSGNVVDGAFTAVIPRQ
jgi:hypothetical protein